MPLLIVGIGILAQAAPAFFERPEQFFRHPLELLNRQHQVAFDLNKTKSDMYILIDKDSGWVL